VGRIVPCAPDRRASAPLPSLTDAPEEEIGPISEATCQFSPTPPIGLIAGASLFLDLDGTLLEIVDRPDAVVADRALRDLLHDLAERLNGRVAVISGRSLAQIDAILGKVAGELALSGSHGSEHRWRGVEARPDRPAELDIAARRMQPFAREHKGVLIEEKSYGVVLHYRMNPAAEAQAQALVAELGNELDLCVQHGKMMVELRVAGADKGVAVRRLMSRPPMQGTVPVFIGDDLTDETGFIAARACGGHGVLIGPQRLTEADYRIDSPAALRRWLAEAIR
jgi:trehalose 6-phosphate phosphatase